jgi:hypothetical protein
MTSRHFPGFPADATGVIVPDRDPLAARQRRAVTCGEPFGRFSLDDGAARPHALRAYPFWRICGSRRRYRRRAVDEPMPYSGPTRSAVDGTA